MFVVTGATSGIGEAVAITLADRGLAVLGVARRADLLAELHEDHPTLTTLSADLATDEGIASAVSQAREFGAFGIVHAAGSAIPPLRFADIEGNSLMRDMAVHLKAPLVLNQWLQPARSVFIDSYSSNELRVGWSGYSIVKAATQMAARACAEELDGVRAIRVFPGAVRTPLVEAMLNSPTDSPARQLFCQLDTQGHIADVSEIGEWIADLLVETSDAELDARETWNFGESM